MLPYIQSDNQTLNQLQTKYKSELDPVIKNILLQGTFLENISLKNGETTFNHLLGRKPQGWFVVDINSSATIYRSKPFNDRDLSLTSNATSVVSLWVF